MAHRQPCLFGWDEPAIDGGFSRLQRLQLDATAWIDRVPGWVQGHERLFTMLSESMSWHASQREMYDRIVDVPRLLASVPEDGTHPSLEAMSRTLTARYARPLNQVTLAEHDTLGALARHHARRQGRRTSQPNPDVVERRMTPEREGPIGGGLERHQVRMFRPFVCSAMV